MPFLSLDIFVLTFIMASIFIVCVIDPQCIVRISMDIEWQGLTILTPFYGIRRMTCNKCITIFWHNLHRRRDQILI